jgi:hypothetical protein
MAAIASAALLVVLWGTYAFLLRGAAGDLRALAPVAVATGTASAR